MNLILISTLFICYMQIFLTTTSNHYLIKVNFFRNKKLSVNVLAYYKNVYLKVSKFFVIAIRYVIIY